MGQCCGKVPKIDVKPPQQSKNDVANFKQLFGKPGDNIEDYLNAASAEVLKENQKDESLAEDQKRKVGSLLEKEVNDTLVKQNKPKYSDILNKGFQILNKTPLKDVIKALVDVAADQSDDLKKLPEILVNKGKSQARDACMKETTKQIIIQIVTDQVEELKNKK